MTRATSTAAAQSESSTPHTALPSVDDLVRQCLPLVNHLVRDVLNRVPAHVNRDDLASAAMYALAAAAHNFDPTLGVPFPSYAALRIRGAITDELRAMDWASRDSRRRSREVEAASTELVHQLGHTPTSAEVAAQLGMSTAELSAIRANNERASVVSLTALAPTESDIALPSRQEGPEDLLVRREELGFLRDAVAELPDRMRLVVEEYFLARRRMADIAAELGVTESRVSQLRSQALSLLRVAMQAAADEAPAPAEPTRRRGDTASRMLSAVASRSTMAERLSATTVFGDSHAELRRGALVTS